MLEETHKDHQVQLPAPGRTIQTKALYGTANMQLVICLSLLRAEKCGHQAAFPTSCHDLLNANFWVIHVSINSEHQLVLNVLNKKEHAVGRYQGACSEQRNYYNKDTEEKRHR